MDSHFAPSQIGDIVACVKRFPGCPMQLSAKGRDPVIVNTTGLTAEIIREVFVEPFCRFSPVGTTIIVSPAPERASMY